MFVKSTSTVLLLCLLSLSNYAQKNLKEAAVVFNGKDTTKGYIDYKEWTTNPTFILFTKDQNTPTARYSASDVNYFDVAGLEQYKNCTVRVSLDKAAVSELGERDTSSEIRTVFLKILLTGKSVTLFSYKDKLKTRYYLQENDDVVPEELLNTTYMFNGQVSAERQYRSTLRSASLKYQPEDKNLLLTIDVAGYYASDIEDVCFKLNGDVKAIIKTTKQQKGAIRLFLGGGINQGSLKMAGANIYSGITSSPFYSPVVDAGFDWIIKPEVGKIVLRGQLHVTGYKTNAYVFRDFTQYTEQYYFKFQQTNIAFTPQLLYNLYNQKKLKWFVGGGFGFNFSSYPVNQEKFLRTSSTNSGYTADDFIVGVKKFWMNGSLSTGIDLERLEFALAYFPKASITRTEAYGIDNSSLQLRVNFFIKK